MAGSKTNAFETDLLELIFENTDLAAIGDGTGLRGSSTAGSLFIALFTADPADVGSATAETVYTNYARVAIARTAGAWTTASGATENTAAITFPTCGATGASITHFGICKADVETVGDLIYHGSLDSTLVVSNGITPEFAAGALDVSED